jgi:hypothetical protein
MRQRKNSVSASHSNTSFSLFILEGMHALEKHSVCIPQQHVAEPIDPWRHASKYLIISGGGQDDAQVWRLESRRLSAAAYHR